MACSRTRLPFAADSAPPSVPKVTGWSPEGRRGLSAPRLLSASGANQPLHEPLSARGPQEGSGEQTLQLGPHRALEEDVRRPLVGLDGRCALRAHLAAQANVAVGVEQLEVRAEGE